MSTLDVLRYLVVGNALVVVLQSIRVIAVYSAVYAASRGTARRLPLHVWMIALSYLILLATTTFILAFVPEPYTASRIMIYGLAGVLGQVALWNVLSYERHRRDAATEAFKHHI